MFGVPSRQNATDYWYLLALAAILVLAAVLRFRGLTTRGYIYWDEGKFALEGVRLHDLLFSSGTPSGKAIGTAKPTHVLLIALADAIVGIHDYSALLMDATAGVIGVALLFFIARAVFNPIIGLLSALFLAVSPYDVVYARSALSESDGTALFLVGVLVWVAWHSRWTRLAAGVLFGLAFTVNYRLIVYCAVVVLFDLLWSWRGRQFYRALLEWSVGLAAIPILWEIVDVAARGEGLTLFRSEMTGRPTLYLQEALYQLHQGKQSVIRFEPRIYLSWYVQRQGWLMMVLIVLGALWIVAKLFQNLGSEQRREAPPVVLRTAGWLFRSPRLSARMRHEGEAPEVSRPAVSRPTVSQSAVSRPAGGSSLPRFGDMMASSEYSDGHSPHVLAIPALVIIPYIVYIFAPFVVPRNLDATVPFACILAAVAVWKLPRKLRMYRIRDAMRAVVLLAVIVPCVVNAWSLGGLQSGFAKAALYIQHHGHGRTLDTSEIMAFYLSGPGGQCRTPILPQSANDLAAAVRAGYAYAVIDRFNRPAARYIHTRMPIVARYLAGSKTAWGENLISAENGNETDPNDPDHYVDVFRLVPGLLPAGPRHQNPACSLNIP